MLEEGRTQQGAATENCFLCLSPAHSYNKASRETCCRADMHSQAGICVTEVALVGVLEGSSTISLVFISFWFCSMYEIPSYVSGHYIY